MKNKFPFWFVLSVVFLVIVIIFISTNRNNNKEKESNSVSTNQSSSSIDACKLFTKEELLSGIGIEFEDKYIQFIWRIGNSIYTIALSGINPSDKQIFENRIQNLLKEKF